MTQEQLLEITRRYQGHTMHLGELIALIRHEVDIPIGELRRLIFETFPMYGSQVTP